MSSEKSELLAETNVRADHVQLAFREHFQDNGLALTVEKAETIAQGQGFTSSIVRLTLKWTSAGDQKLADLPKTVILKAPAVKSLEEMWKKFALTMDSEQMNHFMYQTHDGECDLYRTFIKHKPAPVPVPLVYATWDSRTAAGDDRPLLILMEDLSAKARTLGDATGYLDYEQFKSVVDGLTDLQAWSLRNPQLLDGFEDVAQRFEGFKQFEDAMINAVKATRAAQPAIFEAVDENKLEKYMQYDGMIKMYREQQEESATVLLHGDCWANNIMFEKLPDGSMGPKVVAFIDWQIASKGGIAMDFSRIVSINSSPELHEQKYEDLKRYYFDQLTKKVGREHMPKHLTWEAVNDLLDRCTAQNCLMMLFMQDVMQQMFASGDGPEVEEKKQRIVTHCRYCMQFASKILDIKK